MHCIQWWLENVFFSGCLNMSHAGYESRHVASHNFWGAREFWGQRHKFWAVAYVTMHIVKSWLLKMMLVRFSLGWGWQRTDLGKAAPRPRGYVPLCKVKGPDIYILPLSWKPEQWWFTMQSGVLTSISNMQRSAISGRPLPE